MLDNYQRHMEYIEYLRKESKISRTDFCEGICSDRQYRKYINGESIMKQDKLLLFCKKLGFTIEQFYFSFNEYDKEETKIVMKFYNAVSNKQYETAKKRISNSQRG